MQHKSTERQIHFKIPKLTYTEINTGLPTTEMHKCEERQRHMKLYTHLFYKESEAERETDPEKHLLKQPDIKTWYRETHTSTETHRTRQHMDTHTEVRLFSTDEHTKSVACTHSLLRTSLTPCLCNHFTPDEYFPVLLQIGGRGSPRMRFPDSFVKSPHGSPEVPLIGVLGKEDEKGQSGRKRGNDTREND